MKSSVFTVFVLVCALLLGLSAAYLKSRLTHPVSAASEWSEDVTAVMPLDAFEIIEACGAIYDSTLCQWSFRDRLTLQGAAFAPVYALCGGTVKGVVSGGETPSLCIETEEGMTFFYGGVIASAASGTVCQSGDVIGTLKDDLLTLRCEEEGHFVDPAQFLP